MEEKIKYSYIEYNELAKYYDKQMMQYVPYKEQINFLEKITTENSVERGKILEIGCGTGILTSNLSYKGYDLSGVDSSEKMLEVAKLKASKHNLKTEYFLMI